MFVTHSIREAAFLSDRVLGHAVDYAIAAVNGAVKGREISIPVANGVIAEAIRYVEARAPKIAAHYGENLHAAILARLNAKAVLPAEGTGVAVGKP